MSARSRIGTLLALSLSVSHCGSSSANGAPPGQASGDGGASGSPADGSSADGGGACGARTGMRGMTSRSLTVGGTTRTYVAYLPQSLSAATPAPFVYVFHGATMSGAQMYDITQYSSLADSEGIAVVFPDGQASLDPWSVSDDGAAVCGDGDLVNNPNAVDFAFMDAIKADIAQDQCLDADHVFVTGFSMGGYFTHHAGCDRTDVRAIAPHSGGTIASLASCATGHVPAIIFHGTSDPLIADGCDDPNGSPQSGFPASATLWAQKNGCGTTYTTAPLDGDGGGDGQCYLYDGCPADGQVELCTFTGMGHCWAGGSTAGQGATFACPTYASATQLEWGFFKQYAW